MKNRLNACWLACLAWLSLGFAITSCSSFNAIMPTGAHGAESGISTRIIPGNVIQLTMADGRAIEFMKVKKIDSEEITGMQKTCNEQGDWSYFDTTLRIMDIREIKVRRFDPLKTLGVIIAVPTILIILFPPQGHESHFDFSF